MNLSSGNYGRALLRGGVLPLLGVPVLVWIVLLTLWNQHQDEFAKKTALFNQIANSRKAVAALEKQRVDLEMGARAYAQFSGAPRQSLAAFNDRLREVPDFKRLKLNFGYLAPTTAIPCNDSVVIKAGGASRDLYEGMALLELTHPFLFLSTMKLTAPEMGAGELQWSATYWSVAPPKLTIVKPPAAPAPLTLNSLTK